MPHPLALEGYIAERAFNRPLLLEPQKARIICNVLERRFSSDFAMDNRLVKLENRTKQASLNIIDGVAIIPILGTLVHRGSWITAESGMATYNSLRSILIDAANDSSVKSILLDIDSGGGEVDGNFELANLIRQINDDIKPVVAIANGSAFSGAFSLGVAAGKFYVTPTGGVGSVGVIIQHVDFSEQNEMKGIKVTNIVAGERKAELSPDFPLSNSARQMLQDEVNRVADIFITHVAEMRGIDKETVINTKAALIFGEEAAKIGFVDGIVSFDEVLSELTNSSVSADLNQSLKGISDMTVKKKAEAKIKEEVEDLETGAAEELEEATAEEKPAEKEEADDVPGDEEELEEATDEVEKAACIVEACHKAGMSDMAAGYIREGLTLDQVNQKIDTVAAIKQACKLAGKPERAQEFISSGKAIKSIQEELIKEMADGQASTDISATQSPEDVNKDFSTAKNVILEDVERRKKEAAAKQGD